MREPMLGDCSTPTDMDCTLSHTIVCHEGTSHPALMGDDGAMNLTPDEPTREPVGAERSPADTELPPDGKHLLTDKQALTALGAYLIFRAVTQRVGLGYLPRLLKSAPWTVPLLNNSMLIIIAVGTKVSTTPGLAVAAFISSLVLSLVAGLILYWTGYRFGPRLAERAEVEGSMWASVWNPKQVARAHRWLEKYGFIAVVVGRVVEWFTVPVVLVAGSSRMTFHKFLAAYLTGSALFAGIFLWIGSAFGNAYPWLPKRIEAFGTWSLRLTLVLVVLMALAMLAGRKAQSVADDSKENP